MTDGRMSIDTDSLGAIETTLPRYRPSQVAKLPPCQAACPVSGDIRRWEGEFRGRWGFTGDRIAFPAR